MSELPTTPDQPSGDPLIGRRRTRLAEERTYLAWLRTGLATFAISLGTAKVVPALSRSSVVWPYTAIGSAFALIGVLLVLYGFARHKSLERAISIGSFELPDSRLVLALSLAVAALGVALIITVAV